MEEFNSSPETIAPYDGRFLCRLHQLQVTYSKISPYCLTILHVMAPAGDLDSLLN